MNEREQQTSSTADSSDARASEAGATAYWHANLRLIAALLGVWFTVSFGFGILLAGPLNRISVFGFKLGFWWAQQGSIFVFVILIFVYAALMERLDRRFRVSDHGTPPR